MEEQSGPVMTWGSLFLLTGEGRATHQPPRAKAVQVIWEGPSVVVPWPSWPSKVSVGGPLSTETDQDLFLGPDSDPPFSPGSLWFSQKFFFIKKGL